MRFQGLLVFGLVLTVQIYGQTASSKREWSRYDYPRPQTEQEECGRPTGSDSYICDPNQLLYRNNANDLNQLLIDMRDFDFECICSCGPSSGYRFSIAMVNQIDSNNYPGSEKDDKRAKTKEFADYLRKTRWDYDRCDEDLVIVVSTGDRQVYTSTGAKTQELLKDNCVDEIYEEFKPLLSEGNYYGALKNMIREYRNVLLKARECKGSGFQWWWILIGIGGFLGIGGCCFCCIKCCPGGRGGGGGSSSHHYSSGGGWGWGGGDSGGGGGGGDGGGGGGDF